MTSAPVKSATAKAAPAKAKATKAAVAKKTDPAKVATPKTAAKPSLKANVVKTPVKPVGADAAPVVVATSPKAASAPVLKAKDLVARVAEATGAKVKDIRIAVEATLAELGKALDAGDILHLPPLGRIRITPGKAGASDGPLKLKLNRDAGQGGRKKQEKEALADTGEAG